MIKLDTNAAPTPSAPRVRNAPPPSPSAREARASPEIPATAAGPNRSTLGLVLFGRDAAGKRRAGLFPAEKAVAAERAAAMMGLQVLHLTDPEQARRAADLPRGRLFASGRGLVPLVKDALLDAVFGPDAKAIVGDEPEALPVEPLGDLQLELNPPATSRTLIGVGSMVLAAEVFPLCGWYEAIVVAAPGDDLFTLRWRDWPDDALVARRRDDLALLPPGSLAAAGVSVAAQAADER